MLNAAGTRAHDHLISLRILTSQLRTPACQNLPPFASCCSAEDADVRGRAVGVTEPDDAHFQRVHTAWHSASPIARPPRNDHFLLTSLQKRDFPPPDASSPHDRWTKTTHVFSGSNIPNSMGVGAWVSTNKRCCFADILLQATHLRNRISRLKSRIWLSFQKPTFPFTSTTNNL